MKTCFNTITAGLDRRLEDILAACSAVGFDGVELDLRHIEPALPRIGGLAGLKAMLDRLELAPASVMAFNLAPFEAGTDAFDRYRRGGEVAKALGAPMLLTYCAEAIPEGMSKDSALDAAAARTAKLADAVAPVAVTLEPIGRTALMGGPSEALEIMRRAGRPNVGVMMDTFHYYRGGISDADILAIPRDRLLIVHVNDSEDRPVEELRDGHRLHVGLGILPLAHDMKLWQQIGYDGYLSVEIFREEYWAEPVEKVVRDTKDALDRWLGR
ncbi:Sugar phosphate isomerase/epimerase [Kaistia soli DSM 19436]|uniref:Sugar phosphate isomerase/epimerase n=1 Tax=Kaistia soli DSM 19436 TaxID=1122133 RepID=A0A1M5PFD4_9HYPH|nr:sugar phosphate isomerase/epimerase [Kaistia soli]SHG99973.1 Sugar phosphate isomerase/epimerase [Kaistia soli DSM 19436]